MRKTFVYIAILAVLGAGVYFILPGNVNKNPYGEKEAGFNIKDTGAIGKIFLVAQDGESILLERTDKGWIVNNTWPVLPSTLDQLMNTLVKQQPLYPVTKAAHDNVIKTLSTHGIKTELYDRQGKKMRVFYVGGAAAGGEGTNMLMEGAEQPYVVETPGFVGYLTPRYSTHIRDWRDRTVFNFTPNDIRSVSVHYDGKPDESFTVVNGPGDKVSVIVPDGVVKKEDSLNTRRVHSYLKFFSNINCEGYLNGLEDNDTTFKTAPKHSTIEVTTRSGKSQMVDVYWMALNKRSKNRKASNFGEEVPEEFDSDRMYAVMNDYKDTIMIQILTFQNIFRRGREFYTPDMPVPKADGAVRR